MSRTRFFGAHRTEKAERVAGLILTKNSGAPEEIRTPDPQIRSLVLYPAELRALLCQARTGKRGRGGRGIAKGSLRRWQGFGSGPRTEAGGERPIRSLGDGMLGRHRLRRSNAVRSPHESLFFYLRLKGTKLPIQSSFLAN